MHLSTFAPFLYLVLPALLLGDLSASAKTKGTTAEASTKWKHFECGTTINHGSHAFKQAAANLHQKKKGKHPLRPKQKGSNGSQGGSRAPAYFRYGQDPVFRRDDFPSIEVPTYFHIVTKGSDDSKNSITQDMANAQLDTLNTQYAPYNIHFTLQDTDFTANDAWAVGAGSDDTDMKRSLRKGTYSALNIYFQTDLAGSVLGRCSLPSNIGGSDSPDPVDPSQYLSDGCNVQANTMPQGAIQGYNMGRTAVHETGHWLGLLHVFEGYSCDDGNPGDYVEDTPRQSQSTDGCPASQDSCADRPGEDSIHNFMDYSTDECYTGFTPGQRERIGDMWSQFRNGR